MSFKKRQSSCSKHFGSKIIAMHECLSKEQLMILALNMVCLLVVRV